VTVVATATFCMQSTSPANRRKPCSSGYTISTQRIRQLKRNAMKTQKLKNVPAQEADLPCAIDISSHSLQPGRKKDHPVAMTVERKEVPKEGVTEVLKEVAIEVAKEVAILLAIESKVELTATSDLMTEEIVEEMMTDMLAAIIRINTITIDTAVKSIRVAIVSRQLLVIVVVIENKMILDVGKIEPLEVKIEPLESIE
jgi:hypothetical protein